MKNMFFVGDNLEVMQTDTFKSKVASVDMIYIDPPYNTKKTFSYSDKKDTSDWTQFMKSRLIESKAFLKSEGVVFISIDDSEYGTLKIICDGIYGKENFVGTFITHQAMRSNAKHINICHEYVLCYAKNKGLLRPFRIKRKYIPEDNRLITELYEQVRTVFNIQGKEQAEKKLSALIKEYCEEYEITWLKNYSNVDDNGRIYFAQDLSTPSKPREVCIPEIGLYLKPLPTRGWSSDKKFIDLYKKDLLAYKGDRPYEKHYLEDSEDNAISLLPFYSRQGSNDLVKIGLRDAFDTPKPVELIKYLIRIATKDNAVILDFFAGSGTTAQAVYEINEEDRASRKYILIQSHERITSNTKVYNYCENHDLEPYVSEITKHRIDTYLSLNGKKADYQVFSCYEEGNK